MVRRLARVRRREQPILYLPNWLNQSVVDIVNQLPDKVGRLPEGPLKLLYAGNIGTKQNLIGFCKSLAAGDAPFSLRIHGSGGRSDELRQWVEASGDDRFAFGPFLSEADFVRAIHASDLFLITETAGSGGSFIPSKMIPALATATPILAVSDRDSPLGEEVHRAGLGPHHTWDRLYTVPELLRDLAAEPQRIEEWQRHAGARSRFYARDRVLGEFETALRNFLAGQSLRDADALSRGLA